MLVAFAVGGQVGVKQADPTKAGPGESGRMDRILDAGFKVPASESVLIQSSSLRSGTPAFDAAVEDVVTRLATVAAVKNVRSPLNPANAGQIAAGGHAALVEFEIRGDSTKAMDKLDPILESVAGAQRAHPGFFVGEFGGASAAKAVNTAFAHDLKSAGVFSIPLTLIILVVAFGALVAAGIPLLLALTAVFATFGLAALPSHVLPLAPEAFAVVLLVGLAVGVDYSMFYLRREREERAAGRSERAALEAAAATSGRSVLISGLTVMVAMAGLFLTGDATFASFGYATMIVVAFAMIGSLTVLPALLSKLGDRVDRLQVPFVGRLRSDSGESRVWGAVVDRVLRRPLLSAVIAGGLLLALAAPALQMRMATPGPDTFPKSLDVVKTYNRMQQAFPGAALPANVVVQAPDVNAPTVRRAIDRLEVAALATGHARGPITIETNNDHTIANITIPILGKGTDAQSNASLAALREDVLPRTVGTLPNVQAGVTGLTAEWKDAEGPAEIEAATRGRLRAPARVRADAGRVPLDRGRDQGDRAQPALGRRRLRRARARLPARHRQGSTRLQLHRRDRPRDAAAPVRDPVRALDGLPRLHHQPDPGKVRSRREHGRRDRVRDQVHRRRGHERGNRHGRRLLDLRDPLDPDLQAVRRRTRGGDPDRRHTRPRRAPAGNDEAARRAQLVPPRLAPVAPALRARGAGDGHRGNTGARLGVVHARVPAGSHHLHV